MNFNAFKESLASDILPEGLSQELAALWYDGKGNWDRAHDIAQDIPGTTGAWIHAYLHRKEGDIWNADYWYRRAEK